MQATVLPETGSPGSWTAAETLSGDVAGYWLANFADAELDALVAEALAHNANLDAAAARVAQAEAYLGVARGGLYPTVSALGRTGGELGDNSGLEGSLISASWELDIWGRVRYNRRALDAQYAATALEYRFAQQSLAGLVAKSWFLATEAVLQRDIVADMIGTATNLLDLAEERLRIGIGSEFEVVTARLSIETYRDAQRQIDLALVQALRSLELLVGRYPSAALEPASTLGVLPGSVPAGLPSDLLERRPDVRAAEQRVSAAFNRMQEAEAARLPTFSLSGSISDLSSDLFVLLDGDSPSWSIGGSVFAPLFQGGALAAAVDVRSAEQQEAMANYVQTALAAFGDVEDALASELALEDRELILNAALRDAERALEIAETRYRVGVGDLRQVQEQQLSAYATRTNLLRVQSERRLQRVNLHLALGGDFAPDA
jgi:NodT family efflux transporter outer membrane factor (OMF) lipoprotein